MSGGEVQPELHVACATSREYLPHVAAMLHSLLTVPGGERVHVHYLHGPQMASGDRDRLGAMVERLGGAMTFHAVPDAEVEGLRTRGFDKATWYPMLMPGLLPGLDRVLYLDADLIVLEPLGALHGTDLDGHHLAAVTNVFDDYHRDRWRELGLPGPASYFNSGVIVFNLGLMRRDGSTDAVRDFARAHPDRIPWTDQDALNIVLGATRAPLHPRWNVMNSVLDFPWSAEVFGAGEVEEARARPAVRHFEGPGHNKPWHLLCDSDLRAAYRRHRRATPWPRYLPDGITPRNVIRALARL